MKKIIIEWHKGQYVGEDGLIEVEKILRSVTEPRDEDGNILKSADDDEAVTQHAKENIQIIIKNWRGKKLSWEDKP